MKDEEDELAEEVKRKQQYLKSSRYVEIRVETDDSPFGKFTGFKDGKTVFTPSEKKEVRISEIAAKSNE